MNSALNMPLDPRPSISVVIATHNYGRFLPDAIRSVQAQTFTDWECIIVDDASTDDTPKIVAGFKGADQRIRYTRNATNLGPGSSRNRGISMASGEFIAVLDADDWWEPGKLESQLQAVHSVPGAVLCFTATEKVYPTRVQTFLCDSEWLRNMDRGLHLEDDIAHSSVLVCRTAMEAVGGYDEGLRMAEDWDLWLRIMYRYGASSFVHIDRPLVHYRIHESNVSRDQGEGARSERIVLRRALIRGAWGLRNPRSGLDAIGAQLMRDAKRDADSGSTRSAFYRMCIFVSLAPWRRSRWQRLLSQIALWRTTGSRGLHALEQR